MPIILGTANFGKEYAGHKVNIYEAYRMLNLALENGIEYIDTAEAYENYDILFSYPEIGKFKIITKTQGEVDKRFHATLAHGFQYINKKVDGVSVYEPWEAVSALKRENIKYIQVPYSILDQRLDKTLFWHKSKNIKVFLRSVFLRGYLLNYSALDNIIEPYGLNRIETCLLFALDKGDCVVGADNSEQLRQIISISKNKIPEGLKIELKNKFGDMGISTLDLKEEI